MSLDFKIEERSPVYAFEIAVEVPILRIPKALDECFRRISAQIDNSGAERAGAPYARFLDIDWEAVRRQGLLSQLAQMISHKQQLRIGIPITIRAAGADDIHWVELASGRYVTALHRGAHHAVGDTYKRIAAWAAENGVKMADNSIESYVSDPGQVAAGDLETLILVPLTE